MSKKTPAEITEEFGAEIETLFKVSGPFKKSDKGYMGVLLRDTKMDKIHCHLCGKWFTMMGLHAFKKHGISADDYRVKYGLPLTFPLCGRGLSSQRSDVSSRPESLQRLRKLSKKYRPSGKHLSKLVRMSMRYTTNSASFENKHGACDEQMLRRYLIVCDIVGGQAGQRDLIKYDDALRGLIYRKHGSINVFRKNHGLDISPRAKRHDDDEVVAILRDFYDRTGRVPQPADFRSGQKVSYNTVRVRFGSWNRALLMTGFQPQSKGEQIFRRLG